MIQDFEQDCFNMLNDELIERNNKNKESLEHARNMLKRFFKTFDQDMIEYCKN